MSTLAVPANVAPFVSDQPRGLREDGDLAEDVLEPVDHLHGRRRSVHGRRECLHGDVDELAQAVGGILVERSFRADVEAAQDLLVARGSGWRVALQWADLKNRLVFAHVIPDAGKHAKDAVVPPGEAD